MYPICNFSAVSAIPSFRIWGDFPSFSLLGSSVIPSFYVLGSPEEMWPLLYCCDMTYNSILTDLLNRKSPRANQRRAMAMDVLRYLLILEAITEQKEVL